MTFATRRIESRCTQFRLDVLLQRTALVRRDESAALRARAAARCVVREVSLNCGPQPLVFAHSVVVPGALKGAWRMLSALGARPLGAALFANPRIRRYPLRFRQLNGRDALYRTACGLLDTAPRSMWEAGTRPRP